MIGVGTIRMAMPSWGHVLTAPHPFTLASVVDILLVALVVYECLLLVRGTRASQMLLGLVLLVLVYYLAQWWQLTTLHWLLETALPYAVFGIIVLFQAEIRQGLAKIGRNSLFMWLTRGKGVDETYEDVVLAANFLSAHRIGGLIVIERRTGLRTYAESGIGLDARVSYDLLVTIFRPGGPLHDGAVIIQQDRLAAAACFLPISMNPVLSAQLGTRHRAAIGITEETDAVAVAISESSGAISIAVGGKIEMDVSISYLRERLGVLFNRYVPSVVLPTRAQPGTLLPDSSGMEAELSAISRLRREPEDLRQR